jgi:O-antigen/teichoic acid export membrane protein
MDTEKYKPSRSTTARNITWSYLGHFCKLVVNFGLTSYIVRRLSVTEYGLFLFVIFLSSSIYLLDLGFSSVLVQRYIAASLSLEKNRLQELISTVIAASAVLGLVGAAVLFGLSLVLPGPFNIPPQYVHEASLVFVASAGNILFGFLSLGFEPLYQAANRFDRVNQIQLAGSGQTLLCSVTVLYFGYGIAALAAVQCAAAAFQFLLFVALFPSIFPTAHIHMLHFRWSALKDLLSQSKWAFLDNMSSYISEIFLWMLLGSVSSMREAALFGLASKMPNHLWFLVDRGAGVCLPLMSESVVTDNRDSLRRIYLMAQRLVFGLILPFVVLGSVFARPLIHVWVGDAYASSALVMQWLLLASLAHAILYSSDLLLWASGHFRRVALISASGSIMTLAIALLLVPRYGAVGMAFSVAVVQVFFVCTLFTFQACKYARISLGLLASEMLRGIGLPTAILASGVCVLLAFRRQISSPWIVLAGICLGISYFAVWGLRTALPLYQQASEGSK